MAAPSRTAQFTRLSKILKKYYQPVAPDAGRSVLEHLLFACLLENAPYAAAEEAMAALVHTFFDWNEIRVSSVRELSEVIAGLPQPSTAAHHVKRVLQSVFEATYSFDLEDLRKQNLGPAVERLHKIDGTTPFAVAYAVQAALGGHSIPVDAGTLRVLLLVGLISERDAAAGVVPGLERAIAKNAGMEFGSLLHQLGADFVASPYTPSMHEILLEITPEIKDRLPRRRDGKPLALLLPFDSLGSERGKKTKKGHRPPEGKEEAKGKEKPKGKEEAKTKEEAKAKEETKAKARGAAPEPAPQPAPAAAEEVPSKSKKKPAAAKTKPIDEAGPKPAAAEPVVPPATAEPAAQGELPGAKRKAAAAKKRPAPRKPADPVKLKSEADPAHHDSAPRGSLSGNRDSSVACPAMIERRWNTLPLCHAPGDLNLGLLLRCLLAIAILLGLSGSAGSALPVEKAPPRPESKAAAKPPSPGPLILEDKPEPFVPGKPRTEADEDRVEAMVLFSAARLHEQRGEPAEALRLYERALRCDPRSATIVRAVVNLAARLDRHGEAVRYALKLAELEEVDPLLLKRLGVYLTEEGNWPRALAFFEKAVAARKAAKPAAEDVLLWMEMGRLYHLTAKYDKAADAFAQVLDALDHPERFGLNERFKKMLLGDPGPAWNLIGESFLLAGRFPQAVAAFEKGHRAAPSQQLLDYQLARIDARSGHPDKALQRLQAGFDARPGTLWAELAEGLARGWTLGTPVTAVGPVIPASLQGPGEGMAPIGSWPTCSRRCTRRPSSSHGSKPCGRAIRTTSSWHISWPRSTWKPSRSTRRKRSTAPGGQVALDRRVPEPAGDLSQGKALRCSAEDPRRGDCPGRRTGPLGRKGPRPGRR